MMPLFKCTKRALDPAIKTLCVRSFFPTYWKKSAVAAQVPGVKILRSQIQTSDIMGGDDPIHFPVGVRQWVQSQVQETGITELRKVSSMLLSHKGVSPIPIVEPRHKDGVPLTFVMPLMLDNARYQMKAMNEDLQFKGMFLSPGDLIAFNDEHEVTRFPIQPDRQFESIIWLMFFHNNSHGV